MGRSSPLSCLRAQPGKASSVTLNELLDFFKPRVSLLEHRNDDTEGHAEESTRVIGTECLEAHLHSTAAIIFRKGSFPLPS